MAEITYSVVVPLKDEEDNVIPLVAEIEAVMSSLMTPWELLCIDDGSLDMTLSHLRALAASRPHLRIIAFERNFGQSSAFDAGFKAALGEFVITIDGDLQNDPADIPKLLAACHGADLVCGWRQQRRDSFFKHLTSRVANAIRSRLCHDGVHDTGCSLKVYRTDALRKIKMYQGMHRFLPALFLIEGFTVREVPVNHRERRRGKTKYNIFNRSFNTIADLLAVRWMRRRHLGYTVGSYE